MLSNQGDNQDFCDFEKIRPSIGKYSSPIGGSKFVPKGWGYESWIVNTEKYCGKLLFFKKGKQCSWHFHREKEETFYVHSGELLVYYSFGDCLTETIDYSLINLGKNGGVLDLKKPQQIYLKAGDSFHLPVGLRHMMKGVTDVYMYEFSTTHKEEDSIRIVKGD